MAGIFCPKKFCVWMLSIGIEEVSNNGKDDGTDETNGISLYDNMIQTMYDGNQPDMIHV